MIRILLFIKHRFSFVWLMVEWINGIFFSIIFRQRLNKILSHVFDPPNNSSFDHKILEKKDIESLHLLLHSQDSSDLKYFNPHPFDLKSLKRKIKNPAFLMMGSYDGEKLVGYFFLRFFINRKCFVGRIIDKSYRGKGIGEMMNRIMYEIAWGMGFRCLSTISKNNIPVVRAHARNSSMTVLKELPDNYILVEFVRP